MEALNFLKFWSAGETPETTTFSTAVSPDDLEDTDDDNGPYFDLDFMEDERKSDDGDRPADRSLLICPSSPEINSSEVNSKLQFTGSLLKSAIKCRILTFGFKKSKQSMSEKTEENRGMKLFMVKFKVDDVRFMSLFTRNSSATKSSEKPNSDEVIPDEKRMLKDVMQKYFNKLKFSSQLKEVPMKSPAEKKEGNLPAALRVVCKHLQKSRSASSAAVAAVPATSVNSRRDDSLLQQQDGIQSAILHCKKSFNIAK